jgi:hypothetical protein
MVTMNKKPRNTQFLQINLLQNGSLIAELNREFGKSGAVCIGATSSSSLQIPLYPFSEPLTIIEVSKGKTELVLNDPWDGFLVSNGETFNISSIKDRGSSFALKPGDYGSISRNDLTVLFKIAPLRAPTKVARDPQYTKGKVFGMLLDNSDNVKGLVAGVFLAPLFCAVMIALIIMLPSQQRVRYEDLDPSYLLGTIYSGHLRTLPEALQEKMDVDHVCKSAIQYYHGVTGAYLNFESPYTGLLFDTSVAYYSRMNLDQKNKIAELEEKKQKDATKVTHEAYNGIISLPTVTGESIQQSALRLQNKISIMHLNFEKTLESKNYIKSRFKPGEKFLGSDETQVTESATSKIRVFDTLKPYMVKYDRANRMAARAIIAQRFLTQHSEKPHLLGRTNVTPVYIAKDDPQTSFIFDLNSDILSEKISRIRASQFETPKAIRPKEPLVGIINPSLIKAVIEKNKFDVQLCFELALRKNERLGGAMSFKWRLDSRGEISDIALLSTTIADRQMEKCVQKKIAAWKFPRPSRGSIEVSHQFLFRPAKG